MKLFRKKEIDPFFKLFEIPCDYDGYDLVFEQGKTSPDIYYSINEIITNGKYEIKTDYIVMALGGTVSDETLELGLTVNKWGNIMINENYQASNPKVFAGGDLAGCKGTVAYAARSGREAARCIKNYLN